MSLRHRIVVLIALLVPLSLLAGGVLTYWHAIDKVETEMAAAVALGETTIRDVMSTLPNKADANEQIVRLVRSFDGERHVRVDLLAADGRTAMSSKVAAPVNPAPSWLARALTGAPHMREVPMPAGMSGALRISADPANEIGEVWEDVTLKLEIIAGFFGLVLALVYFALGRALRPLENLGSALAQVGSGNFAAHVPERGPRELSAIYRAFNQMADRLQEAERQNRSLNAQLGTVQEEERADIARDLHDEVGPFLFAVDVDAQLIPKYLERGDSDEARGRAVAIRQSVAHMQSHLRSILSRLRPALLLDLGLSQAVDQLVEFWRKRRSGVEIAFDIGEASYGASLDEVAYRVIQEALSNAMRHGNPTRISIEVARQANDVVVTVGDNGSGMKNNAEPGFGLTGMRERITAAKGTLDVSATNTGGVTVRARLPATVKATMRELEKDKVS